MSGMQLVLRANAPLVQHGCADNQNASHTRKLYTRCVVSQSSPLLFQRRVRVSHGAGHRTHVKVMAGTASAQSPFDIPAAPTADLIPVGPWQKIDGCVCAPQGFKAQGMHGGLRASGPKADISLIVCETDAVAAGVFTQNKMYAAPVKYDKELLERKETVRAVLTNAGQANAATGDLGYQDCVTSAKAVADVLGVTPDDVLIMSTGVIGRRIKLDALLKAVPVLAGSLESSAEAANHAAVAMTTTDLVSKSAALQVDIGGRTVRLGGAAKGSGMIHPNMGTMLAIVTCDAPVAPDVWRGMFKRAIDDSFNCVTVDGDTSTNDTVLGLTSGAAGGPVISDAGSPEGQKLEAALTALLQGLAKSVAWDGEGANCLLEVQVAGTADDAAARLASRSVAASSLFKCAVYGADPNWGRITCAAGYSGADFDQKDVFVQLGDIVLMEKGQPLEFDAKQASAYVRSKLDVHGTVIVKVGLGDGPGKGTAWGCDFSYDYVKINAEYTT